MRQERIRRSVKSCPQPQNAAPGIRGAEEQCRASSWAPAWSQKKVQAMPACSFQTNAQSAFALARPTRGMSPALSAASACPLYVTPSPCLESYAAHRVCQR
jgi:hypothetical protein